MHKGQARLSSGRGSSQGGTRVVSNHCCLRLLVVPLLVPLLRVLVVQVFAKGVGPPAARLQVGWSGSTVG